jgi:hypothetical protein
MGEGVILVMCLFRSDFLSVFIPTFVSTTSVITYSGSFGFAADDYYDSNTFVFFTENNKLKH